MSSDRYATERLPWYLNGTLEAEEQAEVERLLESSDENRAELAAARAAARIFGHRLPTEVIVAYAFDGSHDEVPNELIERHLAVSPLAKQEFDWVQESKARLEAEEKSAAADVLPFNPVVAEAATAGGGWRRMALAASLVGAVALGMTGLQWSRLQERDERLVQVEQELRDALARDARDATVAQDPIEAPDVEDLERQNELLAAGKSDLVDQVARQEAEIERLGEQLAGLTELTEPQLNVPVVDLYPGDMVLRGESQADRVVKVSRETRSVAFILNSGIDSEQPLTGFRMLNASGEVLWTSPSHPQRDELGTFTVSLPVQQLGVGKYTLELVDGDIVVEAYAVEIH